MNKTTAKIHSFESMATLDGEGIRYAVFFCGCPLRCCYCHNPDTWYDNGKDFTVDEVVNKIARYKSYFSKNGGATFSGGEPLLNAKFISEIAPKLKEKSINYVIDTSGVLDLTSDVIKAIECAELIILDLKFWDNESYLKYTGGSFDKVIAFGDMLQNQKKRVWLRTVILPDINDDIASIDKYISLASRWHNIEKYELLAFHTMGFYKYDDLGIENPLKDKVSLEAIKLEELQLYLNKCLKC